MKNICLINPPSPQLLDDKCNALLGVVCINVFLKEYNQSSYILDLVGKKEFVISHAYDKYCGGADAEISLASKDKYQTVDFRGQLLDAMQNSMAHSVVGGRVKKNE